MEMSVMKKKQGLSYYTLSEEIIRRRLLPHSIPLECVVCRRELHVGDKVVRKRRKIYHQECYENTFLDIPDELDYEEEFYVEYGYYPDNSTIAFSTIPTTIPTNIRE
jgi:hypothetical protein